jgi:uncharacterized Tic20 family protein
MKYEDLKLLDELREKGSITEEEYQREKVKILDGTPPPNPPSPSLPFGGDERLYLVLMHLSQFLSTFIIPLIMWLIARDNNPKINQSGKNIVNAAISYTIYSIGLVISIIGIPLLIGLGILWAIFVIIATIKAANGEAWKYPLSIQFIK